jgi:long-chain acyl-CoA synthetase
MIQENFVKVIEKSISRHWKLPALGNYKGRHFTYGEVGLQILKRHKALSELGVNPGDKIALIGRNSAQWGISYLSVVTYGATVVPILADFHPDSIVNIVNHSDAVLMFANDSIKQSLHLSELHQLKAIIGIDEDKVLWTPEVEDLTIYQQKLDEAFKLFNEEYITETSFELPKIPNNTIGVISYTSGTTGFSKGVMLPLNSLMANMKFANENMPLEKGDNLLSVLPLAHAYGCAFEFLWPFSLGVNITFLGKVASPQVMMEAYQEVKPRLLLMVPLIIEKIYKKKIQPLISEPKINFLINIPLLNKLIYRKIRKSLTNVFGGNFREVVIGGAALNRDVERFLRRINFNFSVGYGMTECGPLISYANWDKTYLGSCGKLVDTLEARIDSPDPANIPGEIMVRGENVMKGYYKNPVDT